MKEKDINDFAIITQESCDGGYSFSVSREAEEVAKAIVELYKKIADLQEKVKHLEGAY
jgi:hypothetical protein